MSADGRYVAFGSDASNLVPGDTNHAGDVFVRDRRSGTTERVSVATGGTQANGASVSPAISADGRYVAFYVGRVEPRPRRHELQRRVRARPAVGHHPSGSAWPPTAPRPTATAIARRSAPTGATWPSTSDASNLVPGDTNDRFDVFVRDLRSGTTQRVSVATDGTQANGDSD